MATKSSTVTKTKTSDQISAKAIGTNVIATIDGTKYSRKVNKAESADIMKKITNYNKKPSETAKKVLIKLLAPEATKVKEAKEKTSSKIKGLKQQVKKEIKKSKNKKEDVAPQRNLMVELEQLLSTDHTAIIKLQELLNKFKKVEEKAPIAKITSSPRNGENYRNN